MQPATSICVYCGSSNHVRAPFHAAAAALGKHLATQGTRVVYGGGRVGLMNTLAEHALASGGEVVGVIPEKLLHLELARDDLTSLKVVQTMHERKAMMAELSDAFIALPGGYGTLEELFEAITWAQLRYHDKPVGLLNVDGYYDALVAFLDHATAEQFVRPMHRDLLCVDDDIEGLLRQLSTTRPPDLSQWINNP